MKKQNKPSKEELEIERKTRLNASISRLEKVVEKMDRKKDEMIVKAKNAKLKGSESSLKLAKVGLANALATKKRAEEMLMQLDILGSMRDIAESTKGFLEVVQDTCGDIRELTRDNNFAKVGKELTKTFEAVNMQSEGLATLMETGTVNMDAVNMDFSAELSDEIDLLIEGEAVAQENSMDEQIAQKLERLKAQ